MIPCRQYVWKSSLSHQEGVMNVNGATASWGSEAASGGKGMRGPRQLPDEAVDALADKLGMSSDELKTKLQSSDDPRKVLDQLAQEKGISTDELRETVRSAMGSKMGQAGGAGAPPPPPGGPGELSFEGEAGQKLLDTL